jgi:cytochrome b
MQGPSASGTPGLKAVRVWDLPTRIFHWALVACFLGSIVSVKIGGNALAWHLRFGYAVFALLAFRLIWGFVGGRWSRFAAFIYRPATLVRYLRGNFHADEHLDVGHSPLGSFSVFALLLLLVAQVATGLFADDEIATTGPLNRFVSDTLALQLTSYHKNIGQWVLIALVLLHVGAIAAYWLRQRRDLVGPMLGGDKMLPAGVPHSDDSHSTRALAVVLLTVCASIVAWLVSLGG